jgi:hypothetical protein
MPGCVAFNFRDLSNLQRLPCQPSLNPHDKLHNGVLCEINARSVRPDCYSPALRPPEPIQFPTAGSRTRGRVNNLLIAQGVAADRIQIVFLAAGGFATDNTTPQGRATNQRVEIQLLSL